MECSALGLTNLGSFIVTSLPTCLSSISIFVLPTQHRMSTNDDTEPTNRKQHTNPTSWVCKPVLGTCHNYTVPNTTSASARLYLHMFTHSISKHTQKHPLLARIILQLDKSTVAYSSPPAIDFTTHVSNLATARPRPSVRSSKPRSRASFRHRTA
jgi:hypothetical protein